MSNQHHFEPQIPPAPDTPRSDVTDEMHGQKIADPYRHLEDCEDERTKEWTQAHNKRTRKTLEQLPQKEFFENRIAEVLASDTVSSPKKAGDLRFFTYKFSDENQPRLCFEDKDGKHQTLLNPNEEDDEGLVSLDWWYPSPDGKLVAYGYSKSGDEWSTLRIIDVSSGDNLPESIERARGASVAWLQDSSGFYYTCYPQPGEVPEGEEYYHRRVFYHELGTDTEEDPLIFGQDRPKEEMYSVKLCDDDKYLMISANQGWSKNEIHVQDLRDAGAKFEAIVQPETDALFMGDIVDEKLYVLTNYDAPKYRIVSIDLQDKDSDKWQEIVPQQDDLVLQDMKICGEHIVVSALKDATARLYYCNLDGSNWTEIPLPFTCSVSELAQADEGAYMVLQSFVHSPRIYYLDITGSELVQIKSSEQPVDPDDFVLEQIFYTSRDGTKVPMFLLYHTDTDFEHPKSTLLTGYGGFNISRSPSYTPTNIAWMEKGGVFAMANLRGGSEYGEDWHRDGMRENKQNVFDDFIAAGEYLVDEGYTDPDRLGIMGGSNGGLLVGAAMTQRPELFSAVVCGVPLLDMLRFHRFLIAAIWIPEYGSPDEPEQFEWLLDYSPYHNVNEGTEYPAVYLYTALSDSRVHPMHARKMAALLEDAKGSDEPVLLHVETDAGHGAGKPAHKIIKAQTRIWTFLSWKLKMRI